MIIEFPDAKRSYVNIGDHHDDMLPFHVGSDRFIAFQTSEVK